MGTTCAGRGITSGLCKIAYPAHMENDEIAAAITQLAEKLSGIEQVTDLTKLTAELAELDEQAADPQLWNDQARAQRITSKLAGIRSEISAVANLRNRIDDLVTLFELAKSEVDAATKADRGGL